MLTISPSHSLRVLIFSSRETGLVRYYHSCSRSLYRLKEYTSKFYNIIRILEGECGKYIYSSIYPSYSYPPILALAFTMNKANRSLDLLVIVILTAIGT